MQRAKVLKDNRKTWDPAFHTYQNHVDVDHKDVSTHNSLLEMFLHRCRPQREGIQRPRPGSGELQGPYGTSENTDGSSVFLHSLKVGV